MIAEPSQSHALTRGHSRFRRGLVSLADSLEGSPEIALLLISLAYLALVIPLVGRPLWYDELLTYYIASAPTWRQFIGGIRFVDLCPPLLHLVTRAMIGILGDTPAVVRLPSIVAFLAAALCVYHTVRKRLGVLFGLFAAVVFFCTPLQRYATEARPYALMLCFAGLTMVCWDEAVAGNRSVSMLAGITTGILAMLMSHFLAILIVAPFLAGELARSLENKNIDWRVWVSMLVPLTAVLLYVPILRNHEQGLTPWAFATSWSKVFGFYYDTLTALAVYVAPAILVAWGAALWLRGTERTKIARGLALYEYVFLACLLLEPIFVHIVMLRGRAGFWPRYSIAILFGLSILSVVLLAALTRGRSVAAGAATAVVLTILLAKYVAPLFYIPPQPEAIHSRTAAPRITDISPALPFVAASGLTFLEMNKRESPSFVSRLYYLTDRPSSIRYSHTVIFENYRSMAKWLPIRANIDYYSEFVSRHRHFLVFGTVGYPEDWLIPKLKDDGARLQPIGEFDIGYKDTSLFEATLPGGEFN